MDVPIVAVVTSLLLQVPLPASLSVVVNPTHTCATPEIGDGVGLTLTLAVPVVIQVPLVAATVYVVLAAGNA